jgi:hypothetical protein
MGVILLVGAAAILTGLAVYFFKQKQAAKAQACRSNRTLTDFMAAEMAMKASRLECYKAMLRNPNPQPQPPQPQSPPRNPRGIDWDYVADDNPRRRR